MEAAYDKNNSNCAFDNAMISPPTLPKNCYNESNDVHITEEPIESVDNHQRFEDDFGPETDVDAIDETSLIKSSAEPQSNDSNNEFNLSNGIKQFSLENKIMQQLSEQNQNFLSDSNPFKNDHFDKYSDDHAILDQTTKSSDDSSTEVVVDNKIIDALESLAVSNAENEKHELVDEKPEGDLIDIRQMSPNIPDLTEKADCVHEKNLFTIESAVNPDETFIQHSDSTYNQAEHENSSLIQDDTPDLAETRCVDESVGEDSEEEEEEDEWNYIKGDKKPEEKHNPSATLVADTTQSSETHSSDSVVNFVETGSDSTSEQLLVDYTSESTVQKAEALCENEKIDETKDHIAETEESFIKSEDPVREEFENTAVSIEQELADYENNFSTIACSVAVPSSEYPDPSQFANKQNRAPNLMLEEPSLSELMKKSSPPPEIAADNEVVVEDKPLTDVVTEEVASSETVEKDSSSIIIVENDTTSAKIVIEEASAGKQTTETTLSDITIETSVDEELERPDSLSFEMASKLNPEAKEFVPVSSPTRSNPTSPVANAPSAVPNSFSMLDDDTVVAQSPKKFTTTMDNIDLPAEDDFHHEMNRRPHELEKPSEYVNGNADVSVRSNSPASEPSYQELNLKEAMQADEKLEHDYNDAKQVVVTEDNPTENPNEQNYLNLLHKEQDPMNISIYEARDETLLSNSDELNKVHMLPELDDEVEEPMNTHVDKAQADMYDAEQELLLEEKKEITEPEIILQTPCEEELQSKSPTPEESSAAIYAVASHVVNDVVTLVSQIQFKSPNDGDFEHGEEFTLEEPIKMHTEISTDNTKLDENPDILMSLEQHNESNNLKDAIDIEVHSSPYLSNQAEHIHASERDEMISPLVDSVQNEEVAENEYITDESLLNVQSPSQSMFSAKDPSELEPALNERIDELVKTEAIETTETTENVSVIPVELNETVTDRVLDTNTPDLHQVAAAPEAKVVDEVKAAVPGIKLSTTKPTAKSSSTIKPTASKTAAAKPAKPAAPIIEKRTAKLSATTVTTKASNTSKPLTTSTVKKTTAVGSASSTRAVKAVKPSSTLTIGRSVTDGSATNKLSIDKKEPAVLKKTTTATVNSEVKGSVARKPTTFQKPTTIAKSSAASSGSANIARPSSTSVKSATAKPSTATTKSPTTALATSTTTTTARSSSTVPTAKPRTLQSASSKTVSSTTTTSTVTSKVSSNAITKRFSTVGAVAPKTMTATATTKTTTGVKTTNPIANRPSTVSKLSNTTVTGVRKISNTSPTKKPVSTPITKTRPSSGKNPASVKTAVMNYPNGKVSTDVCTTDLLDLNKQLKNDSNQFITQNGNESKMMVIDSAAD